jgi:hypothetical protein
VTPAAAFLEDRRRSTPGTTAATTGGVRVLVVLLILSLGVVPGVSAARPRVAQAVSPAVATDRALAAVDRDQRERAQVLAQRAALTAGYERQLAEVDRLKRQKASWRRDRQLRDAMASSLETAKKLQAIAARLRDLEARLVRDQRALLGAIDTELAGVGTSPRRDRLIAARATARAGLGQRPHKIVLPDDALDPLADPEELEQQAAALRDSEAELAHQVDSLARQVARFRRIGDLRQQHERAGVLALRDDEGPRRIQSQRRGSAGLDDSADGENSPPPPPPSPPPTDSPPDDPSPSDPGTGGDPGGPRGPDLGGDAAFVLSEIVDAPTLDALRRAERSTDPKAKAAAAEQARARVAERLRVLRERRAAIERRARELRAPR